METIGAIFAFLIITIICVFAIVTCGIGVIMVYTILWVLLPKTVVTILRLGFYINMIAIFILSDQLMFETTFITKPIELPLWFIVLKCFFYFGILGGVALIWIYIILAIKFRHPLPWKVISATIKYT